MWRDNTMDVTASVLGKLSLLALAGVGDALGGIGIGAHSCLLGQRRGLHGATRDILVWINDTLA